jgi:small-conductance mechanosensitive channel/CRP-like cAMP-binding protein
VKTTTEHRFPRAGRRLVGPLFLAAAVITVVLLLPRFGVPTTQSALGPDGKTAIERNWGALAIGIAAALLLIRLLDLLIFDVAFRLRRKATAPALLRQIIELVFFGLCLAILFQATLHVSLTALLATSAIITAVIGLALQDTLGSLFAGVALHMEKTVQVGDMIRVGPSFGTIEELSWRAIKLRTLEGNIVLVPNNLASRERLEVYRRPGRPVARTVEVGLDYDTPPATARGLLQDAVKNLPGVAAYPEPSAIIKKFGDFAIVYELRYWLEDYARLIDLDSQVRERIWYRLDREGIAIAYPLIRQHQYAGGPLSRPRRGLQIPTAIDQLDLFSPLSEEEKSQLAQGAQERRYAPGETIVRQGDRSSSMFLVQAGQLTVSIQGARGETRRLAMLQPGEAFGEIGLLTGEPRTATVRAQTEAVLIEITKDVLGPILESNPSLVEAFSEVMRERRQEAVELYDASKEEVEKPAGRSVLGGRIARFFGIKLRG